VLVMCSCCVEEIRFAQRRMARRDGTKGPARMLRRSPTIEA